MFLDMTLKRNEELVRTATLLHRNGDIPANTYVLDLDRIEENVQALSRSASEHGITLYYMTKQIGRSPFIGQIIELNGIEKAVGVDIDEASLLKSGGCKIGNLGHLVQPSKSQWKYVLTEIQPEVVTLFSFERAQQLSKAAVELGTRQDVILRVIKPTDQVFPGQFGGFLLEELDEELQRLVTLSGIRVIGVTSFPVFQLNEEKDGMVFTSNIQTLNRAKRIFAQQNLDVLQVNAPSATSCYTMPLLKESGMTHGEPGHAITGTTPLHAYREDLAEVPSMVYVSEISHMDQEYAYTIAGGFYARGNMEAALYGSDETALLTQRTKTALVSPENIDYYGALEKKENMNVGDTVIYAFRTQIFVTRAHVAFVRGISTSCPEIVHFQKRGL
ncbi:amino acid racemase [Bacillus sp. LL01]|uniref:YhfX family PLP-dependent enzyme n=1 Tax=Bacillus sp. LL01 TaxID=1665556 RepID=UPI00064D1C78|nr:YhfX family PLP-dependent enzyme [Bacillus sp. LL01]KMJ59078.1 amino acid racemase [Bacillus sp. LL01]